MVDLAPGTEADLRASFGMMLMQTGDSEGALKEFERVLAIRKATVGEEHELTFKAEEGLAWAMHTNGQLDDARAIILKLLPKMRKALGPKSEDVTSILNLLADIDLKQGRLEDAENHFKQLLEVEVPNSALTHMTRLNYGVLELQRENHSRAEALFKEALEGAKQSNNLFLQGMCEDNLAGVFFQQGRIPEAQSSAEAAFKTFTTSLGWEPSTQKCFGNLEMLYERSQQWEKLESLYLTAIELLQKREGLSRRTYDMKGKLAAVYFQRGEPDKAVSLMEEVWAGFRRLGGEADEIALTIGGIVKNLHLETGDSDKAREDLRKLINGYRSAGKEVEASQAALELADLLLKEANHSESEIVLVQAYNRMKEHRTNAPADGSEGLRRIGIKILKLYEDWKKPDRGKEWGALLRADRIRLPPS